MRLTLPGKFDKICSRKGIIICRIRKLDLGSSGVGNMGQCAHLKNYANLDICQGVAIAEIRESLRRKVAARYGIPNTYPTHEEMLKNEALDGIVAAQPFGRYGILVPELLKAGGSGLYRETACRFHRSWRKDCRCYESERNLAHGRLSQTQRFGNDVCKDRNRASQSIGRTWKNDVCSYSNALRGLGGRLVSMT